MLRILWGWTIEINEVILDFNPCFLFFGLKDELFFIMPSISPIPSTSLINSVTSLSFLYLWTQNPPCFRLENSIYTKIFTCRVPRNSFFCYWSSLSQILPSISSWGQERKLFTITYWISYVVFFVIYTYTCVCIYIFQSLISYLKCNFLISMLNHHSPVLNFPVVRYKRCTQFYGYHLLQLF